MLGFSATSNCIVKQRMKLAVFPLYECCSSGFTGLWTLTCTS